MMHERYYVEAARQEELLSRKIEKQISTMESLTGMNIRY